MQLLNFLNLKDTIYFRKSLIKQSFLTILMFFPISESIKE